MAIAFLVIELAVIAAARRFGGQSERSGALVLLAMVAVTYTVRPFFSPIYRTVDPVGVLVDLIGLIGFAWIGINSRKLWPLWAASLQLLSTGAHFVRALKIPVHPVVYYWMKVVPTVGMIFLLIVATWMARRREARVRKQSSPN